jgi:hypothetical protein
MGKIMQYINSIGGNRTKAALTKILGTNWPETAKILFESTNGEMGTAAGAGLSPAIWGDCPRGAMAFDPTLGHFVGDDFTLANGDELHHGGELYPCWRKRDDDTHVAADPSGVMPF